ncbi:MAG: T9SS type A sorting domain-containing protein [Candidatus Stahlbacteria bacterium]|nr:T9SS type A sorting domain-containing protein [Candidatus Stahlbacteria bacterium]
MKRLLAMFMVVGSFISGWVRAAPGIIWENEVRLTNDPDTSAIAGSNGWAIGADSFNCVHVVWSDNRTGKFEIFYKRSLDRGVTWELDTQLTNTGISAIAPSIAVSSSGSLHLVWSDYRSGVSQLYYIRSTDGGSTFEVERILDSNSIGIGPAVGYGANGIVNVVYKRYVSGSWQIFNIYSLDNGVTFSLPQQLTFVSSSKENPVCTIDNGGYVYVVWQDTRDNIVGDRREVYFNRSLNNGVNWESDVRLTYDPDNGSCDQTIAVDGSGKVHVVWHDDRPGSYGFPGCWEIYYKQSPDRGVTWLPDTQLTSRSNPDSNTNTIETDLPSMAVDRNGLIHIVWQDRRDVGYNRVFYKIGNGATWEKDENLCPTFSSASSICISSWYDTSYVHVVWTDGRYFPNYEIYYRRGKIVNVGVEDLNPLPSIYELFQIYPNPFTTVTSVKWSGVSKGQKISAQIYDLGGRLVKTLVTNYSLLTTAVVWDGKDNKGKSVPSGIYFVKLSRRLSGSASGGKAGDFSQTKKLLLLR